MARRKTPRIEPSFVAGHPVHPHDALAGWLEENAKTRDAPTLFKIPVVIEFGDQLLDGVERAWIGTGDDDAPGLDVELDDSTLGIALVDQLRGKIAKGKELEGDMSCAVWLEAHYESKAKDDPALMRLPPWAAAGARVLVVRHVGDLIADPHAEAQVLIAV